MRKFVAIFVVGLAWASGCSLQPERPSNIILMIGDGMGVAPIMQLLASGEEVPFSRFQRGGLVFTHPLNEDRWVTDSAAGATAYATGQKTRNRLLSLRPRPDGGFDTLKTVVDQAERAGMSTGIVVTCQVTHATPAAFYAHAERSQERVIAEQILDSGLDVVFGGGTTYFKPEAEGEQKDLLSELDKRGYRVVTDVAEFEKLSAPLHDKVIGLFAPSAMPPAPDRRPSLADMTAKAIELLGQNPNGFFLMVEGSQIDWAGHDNDPEWELAEMRDFAKAIEVALNFAEKDGKTLVIVTADHETGGMAITGGSQKEHKAEVKYVGTSHTANPVPIFLYGPGADEFPAVVDNTTIGEKIMQFVSHEE